MTPLVATLGRSERRRAAASHYVEGLLMPGARKSIEPMAARVGVDSQSLQQLVTSSRWIDATVWRAIRQTLGDGVYGDSAEFREGLRQLGMEFSLRIRLDST